MTVNFEGEKNNPDVKYPYPGVKNQGVNNPGLKYPGVKNLGE